MRLSRVRIHNFNSFNDSAVVELDDKITIILGNNESGKTSFLRAVSSLDDSYKYQPEELCSYAPNTDSLHRKEMTEANLPILTGTFKLDQNDSLELKAVHESLASLRMFDLTRYYSGRRSLIGDEYLAARSSLDAEIAQLASTL